MAELRRMRPLLGTYVEVSASGGQAESGVQAAFDSIAASHAKWSFQDPDSELSQLNAQPGNWVRLSVVSLRLLRLARGMTAASGGRFNCTVGGALVRRGALPDHRHGDAHATARLVSRSVERGDGRQQLGRGTQRMLVEQLALLGERGVARVAQEQAHAQPFFQPRDALATLAGDSLWPGRTRTCTN